MSDPKPNIKYVHSEAVYCGHCRRLVAEIVVIPDTPMSGELPDNITINIIPPEKTP